MVDGPSELLRPTSIEEPQPLQHQLDGRDIVINEGDAEQRLELLLSTIVLPQIPVGVRDCAAHLLLDAACLGTGWSAVKALQYLKRARQRTDAFMKRR